MPSATVAAQRQPVPQLLPQQPEAGAAGAGAGALASQQPAASQQSPQPSASQAPAAQHGRSQQSPHPASQQAGGQHGQHSAAEVVAEPPNEAQRNRERTVWISRFMVFVPGSGAC